MGAWWRLDWCVGLHPGVAAAAATPAAAEAAAPAGCSTVAAALRRAWPVARAKAELLQQEFLSTAGPPTGVAHPAPLLALLAGEGGSRGTSLAQARARSAPGEGPVAHAAACSWSG